jgi:hypothetical protein
MSWWTESGVTVTPLGVTGGSLGSHRSAYAILLYFSVVGSVGTVLFL